MCFQSRSDLVPCGRRAGQLGLKLFLLLPPLRSPIDTHAMASTQLLDSLFTRLALGSSSTASSSSAFASTSRRSYATQANLLGSLRPVKGAAVKVSCRQEYSTASQIRSADC